MEQQVAESFYLFLTSQDSEHIYKNNNFCDFIVELSNVTHLVTKGKNCNSEWSVALTDVAIIANGNQKSSLALPSVIITCNLLEETHLKGRHVPLLRILPGALVSGTSLQMPYYMKINSNTFSRIRIQLLDGNLDPIQVSEKDADDNTFLSCTLHFQPIQI